MNSRSEEPKKGEPPMLTLEETFFTLADSITVESKEQKKGAEN